MADQTLFNRPDTFFGVCEAIGQDLGFNANWLRVALAVLLLWQPVFVLAGYVAAGALILALRLLLPDPQAPADAAEAIESANDADAPSLAKAA